MSNIDGRTELVVSDTAIMNNESTSFSQPVWQFILLSIMTFGVYDIYWYYRNWKCLKVFKDLDISPGWRTVGLFVPILNFVLIYRAHKDYKNLLSEEGINRTIYPGLIVLVIIFSGVLIKLPNPYWLISFLSTIPLAIVQDILNDFWKKVQPDSIQRTSLRGRQIVLIILGSIWWLLVIFGMTIAE